jgi:hypothetical protein
MRHGILQCVAGAALAAVLCIGTSATAQPEDDEDADAIAELKEAGVDLSKPQTIDFAFYFPDRQGAERTAPKLVAKGFKTRVQPAGGGKDYLLYARKRLVVSGAAMAEWRKQFEALAAAEKGEYDGWGSPSSR